MGELNMEAQEKRIQEQIERLQNAAHNICRPDTNQPFLVRLFASRLHEFVDEMLALSSTKGYRIRNLEELQEIVAFLFDSPLSMLRATSIHSNDPRLQSYKSYWDHPVFGVFFGLKNKTFLSNGGNIQRLYICDSLGSALRENWFKGIALQQVREGASVKVVQIQPNDVDRYEDFGIYIHSSGEDPDKEYVLVAPRELNVKGELQTRLISVPDVSYNNK